MYSGFYHRIWPRYLLNPVILINRCWVAVQQMQELEWWNILKKKAFGRHIDASRLFLYKVTRNLLHLRGDTGAYLRSTMGAMRLFGVPPEEYWEYDISQFDKEPPAFCYAFASNY
jgi:hypothetical protein